MAPRPAEILRFIGRSSKRIAVSVVGCVFVVGGLVMLVLPGPGIIVIVLGFAILGTEYAWAAAALEHTKRTAAQASQIARGSIAGAAKSTNQAVRSTGRRFTRR